MAPRAEIARSEATLYFQARRGSVTPNLTVAGSLRFDGSLLHEIDPDLVFEIGHVGIKIRTMLMLVAGLVCIQAGVRNRQLPKLAPGVARGVRPKSAIAEISTRGRVRGAFEIGNCRNQHQG